MSDPTPRDGTELVPADPADPDDLTADEQALADHARALPRGSQAVLWAFAFDSTLRAQEAMLAAMRLVARGHLELEDAAIVAKVRGKVRITQTKDVNPAQGAVGGAWVGTLAGLFIGGPLLGAALGATAGGLFAKLRDIGISDPAMKQMGEQLGEGEGALFLLVADCHRARALAEVARFPGRVLASSAEEPMQRTVRDTLAVDPWA